VVRARTAADLAEGKRVLVELHRSRWRGDAERGVFREAKYLSFHDAIMPLLLGRGALELTWLTVRGEAVAALYGMRWAGKTYAYQTGRRLDVPPGVRPGGVLLILAIRAAIESGQREFDLLADEAPYKLQLATGSRPLVRVRAAWPSLREGCRLAAEACLDAARRLRRRLRAWWRGPQLAAGEAMA
jgi:CelD/BcsL family acetyltransferase involved in cellulose biosynthesis